MIYETSLLLATVFTALLLEGFRRKAIAKMHSRKGPPLLQPFYDLLKLLEKENLEKNFLFNIVPLLALITSLALLLFVPFSIISFPLDWLVFGYLFILLDTFFLLGAFASRSPFSFHAALREILLMLGYEIGFLIVLGLFLFKANVLSFASYSVPLMFLQMPLASIGLLLVGLVILKVTPFDVLNAEPEISAGLFTEYSGKSLAMLEAAEFIKNGVFLLLIGILLVGRIYAFPLAFLFQFLYAMNQVISPRYNVFKSTAICIAIAFILFVNLFVLI